MLARISAGGELGATASVRLLYSRLHVARVPNSNIPIDDHRPPGTAFLPGDTDRDTHVSCLT